jgi:hypothetical protein
MFFMKHIILFIKITFILFATIHMETWKKMPFLGHVDFFWNYLDFINKNIFHYLMSKNSFNKPLNKSPNLNGLIIL